MPIYEYEHDQEGCERPGRFEILQRVGDPPLDRCPSCGRPCRRVVSTFATAASGDPRLGASNLERLGFTRYEKSRTGTYEKTAGRGPDTITRE